MKDLMKELYKQRSWWLDELLANHESMSSEEFSERVDEVKSELKKLEQDLIKERDQEEEQ